ncbi:MAG: hypothetical protein AAF702_05085 [Chloroflexota bacterium]
MLKRKIVLFVMSVVTALSLYVGYDITSNAFGTGEVASASPCSSGNSGGSC